MLKKMIGGFLVILMGIRLTGCIDVKQKTGKVTDTKGNFETVNTNH